VFLVPDDPGGAHGATEGDVFGAGAHALLDLIEFEQHRPGRLAVITDALDLSVLRPMAAFFGQLHAQVVPPDRRRFEARMWRQLILCRWPLTSPEVQRILAALNVLAAAPVEGPAATGPESVVPGNELQLVLARLRHEPGARPGLWEVLHRTAVHVAVPACEVEPGRGAELSLLGANVQGVRHVFGFTSAEGLERLLTEAGTPMIAMPMTGEALTRFWPADQWLVLDPGTSLATVLGPDEVRGLPRGPHHGVPQPESVQVFPVDPDPARDGRLAALAAGIDTIGVLRLAVMVDKGSGSAQPVLVVTVADEADLARTLAVLADGAASVGVGGYLILPDVDDDQLTGLLRRHGLVVYRRDTSPEAGR
jgi:hypothetical protein